MLTWEMLRSSHDDVFEDAMSVPPRISELIFQQRRIQDTLTAFRHGKEWAFENMESLQPRTWSVLMSGSPFRLAVLKHSPLSPKDNGMLYITHLLLEVNGLIVEAHRRVWGQNPDDPGYQDNLDHVNTNQSKKRGHEYRLTEKHLSLPEAIRLSYYHRIDGLGLPDSVSIGPFTRILPFPIGRPWVSIDHFLTDLRLAKKYLPLIDEMFPGAKSEEKHMGFGNLRMFLSSSGSFTGKKKTDGDYLFVKNHIQDGVVYYIRDRDVPGMTILADPAEAIDRYCEHVLLRKEGRFDFRPWAIPFESPPA